MGDLKLVQCLQNYTLAPKSKKKIKRQHQGFLYRYWSHLREHCLRDFKCHVTKTSMWVEFEWENKVVVNTIIQDEKEFFDHIVKSTNMKCLTPTYVL
ncbi:hypothetical protein F2Q69_00043918 [Brassica cretica]|uniref:Coatomer beta subunit appendage platform domain-containing protein n=1 Tax=Brassica cretica TaxID=69181 RepID=A0A8S9NJH0_BRACR|nr:hypothetical protein F2Q69_00043918 [Brassica cretica]